METLGVWLRQAREARGDTLGHLESATRIRARFLELMEAGDWSAFPGGDVQVRGFLRIYARCLGVSAEDVLSRYNKEVYGTERVPPPGIPSGTSRSVQPSRQSRAASTHSPVFPKETPSSRLLGIEKLIIVAVAIVALFIAVMGVGYAVMQRSGGQSLEVPTTSPQVVSEQDVPEESARATATPSAAAPPAVPVASDGRVSVSLEAIEHIWVRVRADGPTVFAGMLYPAQVETWSARYVVSVNASNGAGLLVTVNGHPRGTMCGRGEVCTRAWGPDGEVGMPSLTPAISSTS